MKKIFTKKNYLSIVKKIIRGFVRLINKKYRLSITPLSRNFGYNRGTPIDRIYIYDFIDKHSGDIVGDCLEVGYPELLIRKNIPLDRISTIGKSNFKLVSKFYDCDLTDAESIPSKQFDTFICTQTFNFIYDFTKAVANTAKLISPNGVLLGSVAGISQISSYDDERWGDYFRFTPRSVKKLLEDNFHSVQITAYGNFYTAIHFLAGFSYEDLESPEVIFEYDPNYPLVIGFRCSHPKTLS
jgi:hypothetical protein